MLGMQNSMTGSNMETVWLPDRAAPPPTHWYRRGVGQGQSGSNINSWTNQGSADYDLVASGDNSGSPLLNSDGSITFNAGADIMTFHDGGEANDLNLGEFEIWMRMSSLSAIGTEYVMETNGGNLFIQLATKDLIKIKIGEGDRHDYTPAASMPEDGTPFNMMVARNSAGAITVFVDNAAATLGTQSGNVSVETTFDLATLGQSCSGITMREIVIYAGPNKPLNRALVNTYLNSI